MKRSISIAAMIMVIGSCLPVSTSAPAFEGGNDQAIGVLSAPGFNALVNLSFPPDMFVTIATMKISGLAAEDNASAFPENVTMRFNNTPIWDFQGAGCGALGMQDIFSSGDERMPFTFGFFGGWRSTCVTLPKDALVKSATLEMLGRGPVDGELVNFSGTGAKDMMGWAVSGAGDVNRDGYDDVIVSACDLDPFNNNPGNAYIFYGGPNMDNVPDVTLNSVEPTEYGHSASDAGDVNGDGYDDVIVSDSYAGNFIGAAYIYLGGPNMDATPDIVLSGAAYPDEFGWDVSGAGDVNNDGYDDVIVGAYHNSSGATGNGRAYLYFGGPNMDNVADIVFTGEPYEYGDFGARVSDAGDVNNDGYDDVIVSAVGYENYTGRVYLFHGGKNMDNVADMVFSAGAPAEHYGNAVSGAGDVNNDGFDDIIIVTAGNFNLKLPGHSNIYFGGASMDNVSDVAFNETGGTSATGPGDFNNDGYDDVMIGDDGRNAAYVLFGGQQMDNGTDILYNATYSRFGRDVSGAGDVDNDGLPEVIIGAPWANSLVGQAFIFHYYNNSIDGIADPGLRIGTRTAWNMSGVLNGSTTLSDLTQALNDYLGSATTTRMDACGNSFVDVPFNITAKSGGKILLSNLQISYQYDATVPNFAPALNNYTSAPDRKKDANGNINVPFDIRSKSAGRIKLSGLNFTRDPPPVLTNDIITMEMDEDTINSTLVDLTKYFTDNSGPASTLSFKVAEATNSSFVHLSIANTRYLSADAKTGDKNNNWTGTVEAKVSCIDRWGQSTLSNRFTIVVRNVNDPPQITSVPLLLAEPGLLYTYKVSVIHGDKEPLSYRLAKSPPNMSIDIVNGVVEWLPRARGFHEVSIVVADGNATDKQDFGISVPNRPPRITSIPRLNASTGVPYTYDITAEDSNMDALRYSLNNGPENFRIDSQSGCINWTPQETGEFDISIMVSDGKERAFQDFIVTVGQSNRAPEFKSKPPTAATVDLPYFYNASARDLDNDVLSYAIESGPEGMGIDAIKGKISWTPIAPGDIPVTLLVNDGKGGEARQEFMIKVAKYQKPQVMLASPQAGKTLAGRVTFMGTAARGSREVVGVQVRVDGGGWNDTIGINNWSFSLNTKELKNGKHALEIRAYDGNVYSDILSTDFTVKNSSPTRGFIPAADGMLLGLLYILLMAACGLKRKGMRQRSAGVGK